MNQKSEADLRKEQEEADAAMARQLQEELNRQEAEARQTAARPPAAQPPRQPAPPPSQTDDGILTVACPACTFLNEVNNPVAGKKYACIQCRTPLPMPNGLPQKSQEPRMVECKICHSVNRVPNKKADAILCGACYQQLGSRLEAPPAASQEPPAAATPAPAAEEEELRTVQIRCGQCSAVNAIQVSTDAKVVQFECGNCTTINEVNLA